MLLLYTAFLAPEGQNTHQLEFAREDPLGLPRPPEQFAALEELSDGYHKRVRAFLGTYVAVAMLDTGSFRNCIDEQVLKMLEAKQEKGELGKKQVISPRRECVPTDVDGAANGYMTTYKEVVEIDVTFKQPGGNSATTRLLFVVVQNLRSKLMIGCPTLDALSFATSYDFVEFRAFDLTLPTMKDAGTTPDTQVRDSVASLQEGVRITPKEVKQIWASTSADPERQWFVKGARGLPSHVMVAEGPAKIVDGKVKLFVCTNNPDEEVVLDTHEVLAELSEPTEEDLKFQSDIRAWRFETLVRNTQALGTEYISELVEHSKFPAELVKEEKGVNGGDSDPAGHRPNRFTTLQPKPEAPNPVGASASAVEPIESVTVNRWQRRRGRMVNKSDTGDIVAVNKEMAQALRPSPDVLLPKWETLTRSDSR